MAALDGNNYAKSYSSNPVDRTMNVGDYGGSKKILLDFKAGAVAADTINIGKLPKGARVIDLKSVGAGTGAAFNVNAMDIMSAETVIVLTVGTAPSATVYAWVEYVVA